MASDAAVVSSVGRCLIVDPARRDRHPEDQHFSRRVADSFAAEGWQVFWFVDREDDLAAPAGVVVHASISNTRVTSSSWSTEVDAGAHAGETGAGPASRDRMIRLAQPQLRRVVRKLRPVVSRGSQVTRNARAGLRKLRVPGWWRAIRRPEHGDADPATPTFADLLATLTERDVVVFPAAEPAQLEMLLEEASTLGLAAPVPTTLHCRFTPHRRLLERPGDVDRHTLAMRLRSGSLIRHVLLHAHRPGLAAAIHDELGLPVRETDEGASPNLTFAPSGPHPNAVECVTSTMFGPVALVVSAFWGRTGSTTVFDAQTRYLIERGFLVVRVFVDPYRPRQGARRRREQLVRENFERVRPNTWLLLETEPDTQPITSQPAFIDAGPVERQRQLLAHHRFDDPHVLEWIERVTDVVIVNHVPQTLVAKRLTPAPMILETHDILSDALGVHGVPEFVGPGDGDVRQATAEEEAVWGSAHACVNLSPLDHERVVVHADHAVMIRPYVELDHAARRSWLSVLVENDLGPEFNETNEFDLMLWGDWHAGNVSAVRWFVEAVRPTSRLLRDARVVLVGRVIDRLPDGYADQHGLLATGYVDEIDDFFARTKVALIADQVGTGLSIKALDVLGRGLPFVSTSAGLRGVELNGTGYAPTDSTEQFAKDVEALLVSSDNRRERAATSRSIYSQNFSKRAYVDRWDRLLQTVVPEAWGRLPEPLDPPRLGALDAAVRSQSDAVDTVGEPRISVVICTYDRYDTLPDAIDSVRRQRTSTDFAELIVVDNSDDQDKARRFAERYDDDDLRYLLEPVVGLSNARNQGARQARAPLVAYLDDDAIASPEWAAELVAAFDRHADAAVVGGPVRLRWVTPRPPWLHTELLSHLSAIDWGDELRTLTEDEWIAGCNSAFRREELLSIGGFSTTLGRSGSAATLRSNEDTDVAARLRSLGRSVVYTPGAVVDHVVAPARLRREWFRRREAWQAASDFMMNPEAAHERSLAIRDHLDARLAHHGSAGLYRPLDDPDEFKTELSLVYDLVTALLAGGPEKP